MALSLIGCSKLVLLSGPMAVGKSEAAASLISNHHFERISSSNYLRTILSSAGRQADRSALQDIGDQLDELTDYRWIVDDVALPLFAENATNPRCWLLDAVRKGRQVDHFRAAVPETFHVHLMASEETLRRRYEGRQRGGDLSYEEAISHPNEIAARRLVHTADLVLNVEGQSPEEIATAILEGGRGDAA